MSIRPLILIAPVAFALIACSEVGDNGPSADAAGEGAAEGAVPLPDWLPDDFPLPDDFVAESNRQFGASTYMLRGNTGAPIEGLYERYVEDLTEQGFEVRQTPELEAQDLVFFRGNGWEDSTVRIIDSGERRTLEIGLSRIPS